MNARDLSARWEALRSARPGLRIRDAAAELGVSELELVLTSPRTERLRPDPRALLQGLPAVGDAMALTRNAWCVHERRGTWGRPTFHGGGKVGLVVGPDIDLRLFLDHWVHLIHTVVDHPRGELASFQVFDASGTAVQKVYRKPETDADAWDALRAALVDPDPAPVTVTPAAPEAPFPPLDDAAAEAFRAAWAAMRDTHDAFGLLRKHEVDRLPAMRLLGEPWARPAGEGAVDDVLAAAAATGLPIMVFVGNPGCVQIHTGPVERVARRGAWLNVLDDRFSLHLDTSAVAEGWIVRKPTDDGPVHSLELFAADGLLVAQLFGARKPGRPEDPRWTELVAGIPTAAA